MKEKRERERVKNRKLSLKSGQNGRYNNGEQKGSFLFKERNKQTNGKKKREKFCGRRKKK